MPSSINIIGLDAPKSYGAEFWPPTFALQYSDDDFDLRFPRGVNALKFGAPREGDSLYPIGITKFQMHWLNWRVASIGLRGGYFNDFPRHSWPGSTNQLPSDERRLLGFPGCAIYDDSPDLHNYFTCCLGFPMHTIRHDALNNPTGYINLPTGLANPVLTDSLIFPNWQFFIGAGPNGENILTTPAACLFGEEKVYPFVRVEWFVPIENSIYSTVQWVSESSRDTGKRMHFFDWGVSAPIYQFWAGSPPDATLTDDVYMEATEFFSYGGIYDRQTGKAKISPVPTF